MVSQDSANREITGGDKAGPVDPGHGLRWLARIVLTEKLRVGSGRAG